MTANSAPSWVHLATGETIVWESRPHPFEMGPRLLGGLLVAIIGIIVAGWTATDGVTIWTGPGVLISMLGVAVALAQYVVWTNTRYVITSEELYKKHGVVTRDVTQFRLDRVQNTSFTQSVSGRLFGYGELTVYTAGSGEPELTFERVPHPNQAINVLSRHLQESPVESNEQTV